MILLCHFRSMMDYNESTDYRESFMEIMNDIKD